ncbi:MAG: DNA-processing protein DprA [Hyphomicrobiaceae bacterium]
MSRRDLFAAAPLPVARFGDAERLACLRLIRSENVGPVTFRALINRYGGAQRALRALPALCRHGGRGRTIRICSAEEAEAELDAARRIGSRPLFTVEPGYPKALAAIETSPPLLYVKGDEKLLGRPIVAIVGARQSSAVGQRLTRQLAAGLGRGGYVVASGLARGIDGTAHHAALETGTVAVVAGGIDVIYPPEHADLYRAICERGCLVSEQPPGFQPRAQDFPRRNRIVSGLALGVLVVEAARRSGSLITARFAAEQGREVFAVPGHPLDPRAEGTNALLKTGATLVTAADDILTALAPLSDFPRFEPSVPLAANEPLSAPETPSEFEPAADDRTRVVAVLGPTPAGIDDVARAAALPIQAVQIVLMELALAGRLEFHGRQLVSLM